MAEIIKHIQAFDCLPFDDANATSDVVQQFIRTQSKNVFRFSTNYDLDEDSKLAEYDYRNNNWVAGRFVGESIFRHNEVPYKLTIKPRFGEKMLFRMLEEIFNIKITASASEPSKSSDWQHYIRKIIGFIWLQKLANANLHGVPKSQVKREHKGGVVKGRLNVRKSMKPWHRSNELVSNFREKELDNAIAQIISSAYDILKSDFAIGQINIPDSAKQAINEIHSAVITRRHVTQEDYRNIRYKDIYLNWKSVVDLSWDITKRKQLSLKQDNGKAGFGFFIDMAEVWEQYIRSLLKRNLVRYGWRSISEKRQIAYRGYFWQRELIPDLVFQKENLMAVWDAKYKRMMGRKFDVDRSDFFQIHTYIQYHLNHKSVKAGGLLYPISTSPNFDLYSSPFLINEEGVKMNFTIDGIELTEMSENQNHKKFEVEFIDRIIRSIS